MVMVICMDAPGGVDQLSVRDMDPGRPGPGALLVEQTAIGVNFVDIYHRKGLHKPPTFPAALGVEAVGIVAQVGPGVTELAPGDRVAMAGAPVGSYAEARVVPASAAVRLPDDLPDARVAGSFLRGLTAHLLLHTVGKVRPGQRLLIHGAAGGLGLILVQWAKRLGAETFGVVGSEEKACLAQAHGLDHAIRRDREDFAETLLAQTNGRGVDFIVDGIGGETFTRSLGCLAPFGLLANVGMVGGPLPVLDPACLINRFLSRPSILAHLGDRAGYERAAEAWFDVLGEGLSVAEGRSYPLAEAARAQMDLETGATTGALRLLP
ncbi:MAG: quinone oxidoreductase [Rhodospirillum sp.]|nr:quinone oxidoreductase [Rhodospirillum sp.]MCF8490091.1 quinone oxidoreductase [Rhodospirillum sp.]